MRRDCKEHEPKRDRQYFAMEQRLKCNDDCLNCKLEKCIYDGQREKRYHIVRGGTEMLSQRLKEALQDKNYTQTDLARETKISNPTISGYLKGRRVPRADHLYIICKCLDVSSDWMIGLNEYKNKMPPV